MKRLRQNLTHLISIFIQLLSLMLHHSAVGNKYLKTMTILKLIVGTATTTTTPAEYSITLATTSSGPHLPTLATSGGWQNSGSRFNRGNATP